jgi:hypothetical protein
MGNPMAITDHTVARLAGLSSALAPIFRGRFCDILLPNRAARTFAEDEVMYDLGDSERTFFFVRRGVAWATTTAATESRFFMGCNASASSSTLPGTSSKNRRLMSASTSGLRRNARPAAERCDREAP